MFDRYMRMDSSRCDPSRITLDLRSLVIRLGAQLEESFLTHLSTRRFSLIITNVYWKMLSKHYGSNRVTECMSLSSSSSIWCHNSPDEWHQSILLFDKMFSGVTTVFVMFSSDTYWITALRIAVTWFKIIKYNMHILLWFLSKFKQRLYE